ncbi:hypothetical protein F3Y22_tig00111398pilonHSYRG00269 [Hibiscus syriacus]|uniref:Uncharacterized protein n=1 Tax=Hibiscus syriacus TaxID=106335 RepID=A0A6A2XVP4_HIBSY|nr:hypothetical protein F3Y22_tig00111398pilonHSYRG00269 [Hibiscus syriacus]
MKAAPTLLTNHISYHSPSSSFFSSSSSSLHSTGRRLQSCGKTPGLIFGLHHFQTNPSRNLDIPVQKSTQLSSRQRNLREKSDLEEAFESAKTSEEIIRAYKDMEACFDERELGIASLKVGLKIDREGEDPEKALSFADRALKALDQDEGGDVVSIEDIRPVLHAVQLEWGNVKTAMGRREEALFHLKKAVEIKEVTLEKDCKELGVAYRDLDEAYVSVLNFKEALPLGLKALEIHMEDLGHNSVEVAHDRRILGVIYTGMEEHEKALELNELSRKVLKNWGLSSVLFRAEIDVANMQIALGKYNEAINTLKDSKKYLEIAYGVLDKKKAASPIEVAEAYSEISMLYETMNEVEAAISLLKRTSALLEKQPQEQHSEGSVSARIGWLLLLKGEVSQAIPYLESAAERLKECFGSKHFGVGYIYNNLGAAYLELERPQSAAQMFAVAKDIMDVSLGPPHADSIETCQNLSKAYSAMGSYTLAVEFQLQVTDAWEGHGPSAKDEFRAQCILEELKMKFHGTSSNQGIKDGGAGVRVREFDEIYVSNVNSDDCFDEIEGKLRIVGLRVS